MSQRSCRASHPDRLKSPLDSPYAFAVDHQLKTKTFDDFLNVIEEIFKDALAHDCVCLKSTQAYQRTLRYEQVTKKGQPRFMVYHLKRLLEKNRKILKISCFGMFAN